MSLVIDLDLRQAYSSYVFMRRFFSITAILALMFSIASPWLMAASCPHMRQMMACCHHAKGRDHHCNMMQDHLQAETAAPASSAAGVQDEPLPMKCPMGCCCCGPQHPTTGVAAAPLRLGSYLIAAERTSEFAPVVFTTSGFSSHTDRGPPCLS